MNDIIKTSGTPGPDFMPSVYGNKTAMRASELPGMCSVAVNDLFPSITKEIYKYGDDLSIVRKATEDALEKVDMSMIKPDHAINIGCSEHGFSVMGGHAYTEMLRTIRDVVKERTGNTHIKLALSMYKTPQEALEVIEHFDLAKNFEVEGSCPFDKGIPIETEGGTFWGIKKVYDCDWLIHAYYDDPREMYAHRFVQRCFKSFVMNYARYETRCSYHMGFGGRAGNIIPQLIHDSDFVQGKLAFGCYMNLCPSGIATIDAENDLYKISNRSTIRQLKDFGFMLHLLRKLDNFIAVWDGGRWGYYLHVGGVCFGNMLNNKDPMDLDVVALFGPTVNISEYKGDGPLNYAKVEIQPSLKAVVSNQSWPGIAGILFLTHMMPTYIVGEEQRENYRNDRTNPGFADTALYADTLEEGIAGARAKTGVQELLVFDGSFSHINCTRGLAEQMVRVAPDIEKRVTEELYPKYLRQRGIDPAGV
jgi:hypothetical protein